MTSRTNTRQLERLNKARSDARERFARQMKLMEQIAATAGERERLTGRWNGQLAALAHLSGGAAAAAQLSGLPRADIEAAVRGAAKADADAAVAAADLPARQRRGCRDAVEPGKPARPAATA